MNRDHAIELARRHATRKGSEAFHTYQPTPEQARYWVPHEWIINAILAADAYGLWSKGHHRQDALDAKEDAR